MIVLTPEVIVYPSTVQTPDGWEILTTENSVTWQHGSATLPPGGSLDGFSVCFDNDATGNQDFRVLWQSTFDGMIVCQDTLLVKCDRTLGVERLDGSVPEEFTLKQNFPNPFNPITTIEFAVPYEADVDLALYDMSGRHLRDLGSGTYSAGTYRVTLDGTALPSGTYVYRLRAGGQDISRRMLLLK
jgi:hypothetical protein